MKTKYEYHKDLKLLSKFHFPVIQWLIPIFNFFLGIFYLFQISNKRFLVEKKKIKSKLKEVKFLIYTPKKVKLTNKCLIYIHGGGFAYNSSPNHYKLAKIIGEKICSRIVYINYKLAPRYKFPTPLDDCFSVYNWILDNANDLNIDINKIILCGDSAGGNLCANLTNMAFNDNLSVPSHQILLYPVVTYNIETDSNKKYTNVPMCNSKDMKKYSKMYYNHIPNDYIKYLSPLENEIFENYPKTYIEIAEYDCLHDDGLLMHQKLLESSKESTLIEVEKAMHGYDFMLKSDLVQSLIERRVNFINK